jgi:methanethiol S-methyltransferase
MTSMHDGYAYGNWGIAIAVILVSLFFLFKFIPMRTRPEQRSGGALIAFLVALFTEMYGFPLTIYFASHFLGIRIPLDHVSGHLLGDLITYLGLGNGWFIVMLVSNLLLIAGIWLVSDGWELVYRSKGELVTSGVYSRVRHPQYAGIFVITLAFMIQWPTLPTLILWPFVIAMYVKLARREEQDVLARFPVEYRDYMKRTPMFVPRLFGSREAWPRRQSGAAGPE